LPRFGGKTGKKRKKKGLVKELQKLMGKKRGLNCFATRKG